MHILVTMSRTWLDYAAVWRLLDDQLRIWSGIRDTLPESARFVVMHGGAKPEKQVLEAWAAARPGVLLEEHRADWINEGRKAGILRNLQMVKRGADLCLAFIRDNSRGATHCATTAHMAGIETKIERAD